MVQRKAPKKRSRKTTRRSIRSHPWGTWLLYEEGGNHVRALVGAVTLLAGRNPDWGMTYRPGEKIISWRFGNRRAASRLADKLLALAASEVNGSWGVMVSKQVVSRGRRRPRK